MRRCALLVLALLLAPSAALGHGASRGLHLHVEPEPARAGEIVRISLDASERLRAVRVGLAGGQPVQRKLRRAIRHVVVKLRLPEGAQGPLNVQAEAMTIAGGLVRASAVVRTEPAR